MIFRLFYVRSMELASLFLFLENTTNFLQRFPFRAIFPAKRAIFELAVNYRNTESVNSYRLAIKVLNLGKFIA